MTNGHKENGGPPATSRRSQVKEGGIYEVYIEDIAREGDGIARIGEFVIFVPNTEIGDEVTIKVNKVMRKFAFAEVDRRTGLMR